MEYLPKDHPYNEMARELADKASKGHLTIELYLAMVEELQKDIRSHYPDWKGWVLNDFWEES